MIKNIKMDYIRIRNPIIEHVILYETISNRDELMSKQNILNKKDKNIEELLNEEKKKSETYLDQYKYLKADFENYKKIMEKEMEKIIKCSNERIFIELLPILDDMENALKKTAGVEEKKGLEMILNNFFKILQKNGLKSIDALSKKFDPYYHEVLMKKESDNEDDIVIEEIQKGYMLNNKVVRHSKVKVSKKK